MIQLQGRRCVGASIGPFKAQIFHWGGPHSAWKDGKGSSLQKATEFQSKPLLLLNWCPNQNEFAGLLFPTLPNQVITLTGNRILDSLKLNISWDIFSFILFPSWYNQVAWSMLAGHIWRWQNHAGKSLISLAYPTKRLIDRWHFQLTILTILTRDILELWPLRHLIRVLKK